MTLDVTAVLVSALALLGVMTAAMVSGGVALVLDLRKTRRESRLVWMWARELVDHIYRGNPPPPPEPPAAILNLS